MVKRMENVLLTIDGDKYDGEWKYDKVNGKGIFYFAND